jgi:hypothetical protein
MPESVERAGDASVCPAKEGGGLALGGHSVPRPQKTVMPISDGGSNA